MLLTWFGVQDTSSDTHSYTLVLAHGSSTAFGDVKAAHKETNGRSNKWGKKLTIKNKPQQGQVFQLEN